MGMKIRVAHFRITTRTVKRETKSEWGEYATTVTDTITGKCRVMRTETESGGAYCALLYLRDLTNKDGQLTNIKEDSIDL